jgi:extradiol dioxygenase family protein
MKNIVAFSRNAQRAGERRRARATMFFLDRCGDALEFKAFSDPERLFAK